MTTFSPANIVSFSRLRHGNMRRTRCLSLGNWSLSATKRTPLSPPHTVPSPPSLGEVSRVVAPPKKHYAYGPCLQPIEGVSEEEAIVLALEAGGIRDTEGSVRPTPLLVPKDQTDVRVAKWQRTLLHITRHCPQRFCVSEAQDAELNEAIRQLPESWHVCEPEVRLERLLRSTLYRIDREVGGRSGVLNTALWKFLPYEGKEILGDRKLEKWIQLSNIFQLRGPTARLPYDHELKKFLWANLTSRSPSAFTKSHLLLRHAAAIICDSGSRLPDPLDLGFHNAQKQYLAQHARSKLQQKLMHDYFSKRADAIGRAFPVVNMLLYQLMQDSFINLTTLRRNVSVPKVLPLGRPALSALIERGVTDIQELRRQARVLVSIMERELTRDIVKEVLLSSPVHWATFVSLSTTDRHLFFATTIEDRKE